MLLGVVLGIALAIAFALLLIFVCIPDIKRCHALAVAFEERFPPISDDEYLARFRSPPPPDVAMKVRRVLSDALGVDYETIHPNARLVGDLGAE